jgi:PKD repeat protein
VNTRIDQFRPNTLFALYLIPINHETVPSMKKLLRLGCRAAIVLLAFFSSSNLYSQEKTAGTLTFTFETINNGGKYAPKHILAVWVEDASGFVITSKLRADKRKQYLYTWNNRSSGNTVDAITGATLGSHQSHTITWNGTDVNGNIVPDGDYIVRVEFTDAHAQGPLYSLTFPKGTGEVSLAPANAGKFRNISLLWKSEEVTTPEADFSYTADELTVKFVNSSLNADSFSWDFGDTNTSTESDPIHTYAENGTYHVVLEATAGAVTVTAEHDITLAGGATLVEEKEGVLKVFPNPVNGKLMIENSQEITLIGYIIVSMEGRTVKYGSITGFSQIVIGLDGMQQGAYVLKLQGTGKEFLIPFVKK